MNSYQTFTALLFVAIALWLASCGINDPAGTSRNGLGFLGGSSASQDTTVQSSGGLTCTATVNPSTVQSGGQVVITLTVSGAQGTISIPQAGVVNSSNTVFQIGTVLTINSGTTHTFHAALTVTDSQQDSASCPYQVTITR